MQRALAQMILAASECSQCGERLRRYFHLFRKLYRGRLLPSRPKHLADTVEVRRHSVQLTRKCSSREAVSGMLLGRLAVFPCLDGENGRQQCDFSFKLLRTDDANLGGLSLLECSRIK